MVQSIKLFFSAGGHRALSDTAPDAIKARYIIQWYICRRAHVQFRLSEFVELQVPNNINMDSDSMGMKGLNLYKNFKSDDLIRIGDCILKDLESAQAQARARAISSVFTSSNSSMTALNPSTFHTHLMAAYLLFSSNEDLFALHHYDSEFACRLFETLQKAPKVMRLDQMYPLVKDVVDRMMCKAIDVFPGVFLDEFERRRVLRDLSEVL
ncbi:hypothetical protein K435DRAFT_380338 [Dendrothele bispora CBS 962.96]|uniref:Uncharacterized protein n=1 Tax=Dendrothele bispora (strain CBS 962.96) TaxID=1314807 RepID=A0A4S8MUW7_DENBC|nr:hypothetical protein K435DRAFT_380338 [Dendrothele bispora CBS 962.96]